MSEAEIEEVSRETAAQLFLDAGVAETRAQAEEMADVLNSPLLSPGTVLTLLWIGVKKGAAFDVDALTDEEISQACDEVNIMYALKGEGEA